MASLVIVSLAEVVRILRRNPDAREHRLQAWCRWEDTYSPENWASGSLALTIVRGACSTSAYTSAADHRFPQQALFPSAFQLQVGWVLQEHSSEFFPVEPGIPSSATRRTRKQPVQEFQSIFFERMCQVAITGATAKPRQVSVLLHPVVIGSAPLLWLDWSRRNHRRACIQLLRHQRVEVQVQSRDAPLAVTPAPLSRAERAHYRLTWAQRLTRNARPETAEQIIIRLFGVPERVATLLGLAAA